MAALVLTNVHLAATREAFASTLTAWTALSIVQFSSRRTPDSRRLTEETARTRLLEPMSQLRGAVWRARESGKGQWCGRAVRETAGAQIVAVPSVAVMVSSGDLERVQRPPRTSTASSMK